MFAGNGASASIANHASLDFTKQAKIKSVNFNESALITAFANDYGYENWIQKAVKYYGDESYKYLIAGKLIDIAGFPEVNIWKGKKRFQFNAKAIRLSI